MENTRHIRLLPPELQNQIAAGEVVERPSSVVKELLENSLDAGASRICLEIQDGGQSLIRLSDNGCGIPADEIELALTRHATSKLSSLSDLQQIHSFGFRGEALPSIASVSRFRISSATTDGEGTILEVEYGRILDTRQAALPRGTEIEITELFSNVPARLKFLKQPATESRRCSEAFIRTALANLEVDCEFINSGRSVYRFLPGQTLRKRLEAVWPPEILQKAHDVDADTEQLHIHGLAGAPSTAQARADRIFIYVNRRPVQDKMILSAVRDAYRGRILGKEFPQAVLFISIAPDEIDVNVHPAKTEIRFQDESRIFRAVRRAVIQALESAPSPIPPVQTPIRSSEQRSPALPVPDPRASYGFAPSVLHEIPARDYEVPATIRSQKFGSTKAAQELFKPESIEASAPSSVQAPSHAPEARQYPGEGFRYLGQFAQTYLILAQGTELLLVDQHAAHERVLYNTLRTQSSRGDRQPLLLPLDIPLHKSQATLVQEIWAQLTELGFSLELTKNQTLSIHAIPTLLTPARAKDFLNAILLDKATSIEDIWAVMSCRAAIKAGDALTADEALALIEAWTQLPDCDYCPHGRPVVIRWTTTELEKLFKRRA